MTAGVGWIGEINNQFNITKGYTFAAVTDENIPPNITFDGQHAPTKLGHERLLVPVDQPQAGNRHREQLAVDEGTQHFQHRRASSVVPTRTTTKSRPRAASSTSASGPLRCRTRTIRTSATTAVHSPASCWAFRTQANRSNSQELELRNWDFSPYIQDDIKLSPRLTVNRRSALGYSGAVH